MSATMTETRVHIRWMIRRDMPEVLAINPTNIEKDLWELLDRRNVVGMVAEHQETGNVVGFMIYELCKTFLQVAHFCVKPELNGQGIGKRMVEKLQNKVNEKRRIVRFNVPEHRVDIQLFLKAQGFFALQTLPGYFQDTKEDAYVMEYEYDEEVSIADGLITA